jgi:hypothetical protein
MSWLGNGRIISARRLRNHRIIVSVWAAGSGRMDFVFFV